MKVTDAEVISDERLAEIVKQVGTTDMDLLSGREIHAMATEVIASRAASQARALSSGEGWQDIATAPKDGTRIWVAEVTDEYVNTFEARWCTLYGINDFDPPKTGGLMSSWWALSWRVGDSRWPGVAGQRELSPYGRADLTAAHPTHWQPLPHPPSKDNTNE